MYWYIIMFYSIRCGYNMLHIKNDAYNADGVGFDN